MFASHHPLLTKPTPLGLRYYALYWTLILSCVGCTPFANWNAQDKSPLRPFAKNDQQTVLEITTLRLNSKTASADQDDIWTAVEEQSIPMELRTKLMNNGFRVGVLRGEYPATLQRMISTSQATTTAASMEPEAVQAEVATTSPDSLRTEIPTAQLNGKLLPDEVDLDDKSSVKQPSTSEPAKTASATKSPRLMNPREPGLRRHTLYLQPGQLAELQPGGLHDNWPLLVRDGQGVHGRSLKSAQGVLQLSTRGLNQGEFKLLLAPEIQHGDAKPNWIGEDGMLRQEYRKPKELFPELQMEIALQAGQTLVLAPILSRPGSVGHYFLSQAEQGESISRLLLIRVVNDPLDQLWK